MSGEFHTARQPGNGTKSWFSDEPDILRRMIAGTTQGTPGEFSTQTALGDRQKPEILWSSRNSSCVATPVLLDRRLHWIDDRGIFYCEDADTGQLIHRARIPGPGTGQRPVYASPIAVAGRVYIQTPTDGLIGVEPSCEPDIVAHNKFESDASVFNAIPAVDNGQLFLRSDQYLSTCIA